MTEKRFEDRLRLWNGFRTTLESAPDPIQAVIDHYQSIPTAPRQVDPWDRTTWPDPLQLINENQYCEFCKILGITYSLQLTERFKSQTFRIHTCTDTETSEIKYLMQMGGVVIGCSPNQSIFLSEVSAITPNRTTHDMTVM
jgi:hypothetical protein